MQHKKPIDATKRLLAEMQAAWPSLTHDEILTLALRALHTLSAKPASHSSVPDFTEAELETEIWKPLTRFPGCSVSNLGRVRGGIQNPDKVRSISRQTGGYGVVLLRSASGPVQVQVSRTVAEHFIRKSKSGEVLNHKNGNKLDNRVTNIEWTSQEKNVRHSNDTGLRSRGSHKFKILSSDDIKEIGRFDGRIKKGMLAVIYGIKSSEVAMAFKKMG